MTSMKSVKLTLLFFSVAIAIHAQDKLTLKQSVEIALKNNIQVKQAGLLVDRDETNRSQAWANLLPNLNGSFSYGWNQGRNIDPITNAYINQQLSSSGIGLNSNVVLFAGLQAQNFIKQTSLAFQASKLDWEQSKNNLTLNVLLAYLLVLTNEDVLEISRNQAAVTRKQVERLEVMVREGAVGQFQLTDIKGQLASEEIAIINNENALETAKLSLCQLLNIPYNKDLKLDREEFQQPAGFYAETPDQIYLQALKDFAQVKATDYRVKSLEKGVKVAQSNYFPTVSFGANIFSSYSSAAMQGTPGSTVEAKTGEYITVNNTRYDVMKQDQNFSFSKIGYGKQLDNNLGTYIGFNVQVPVFNNFRVRNQVRLARISLKNAELENANIKYQLRQNIEQAHLNMSTTYKRYKALQDQVNSFEISFRAAEIRFNNGVINPVEYLQVKNNLDRSRVNHIVAMYEYILRTKVLDFYQAKLNW